jgi:hypothetical protein
VNCTLAKEFWIAVREFSGAKVPWLHSATWTQDLLDPKLCPSRDAAVILCGMQLLAD